MNRAISRAGWILLVLLSIFGVGRAEPVLLSEFGSERSTTGPGNNIVTREGKTHVVWQDADANGYWSRIRTLNRGTGTWAPVVTLGLGVDNHARPCLAIDSTGHLHMVIGGHNTMMYYRRSVRPNDASAWTKPEPVDAGAYPMLVCGSGDALVLGARPKTHDGVNLYVRGRNQRQWEKREQVLKRNAKYSGYAGYNVALAWGADGSLHFAADVYEGRGYTTHRGTHQAIVYMVSHDLGRAWQKADGSALPPQPNPGQMDVLARHDVGVTGPAQFALLRNGGLGVNSNGRPYVYFTDNKDGVGRPRLATVDESRVWHDVPLADAFRLRWPSYQVPGARGHLNVDSDDVLHVLIEFSQVLPEGTKTDRFERRIGLGLLTSRDGGKTFAARELLALDSARRYSQASLERQTGHNDLSGRFPGVIFTDGLQRYPVKGEVINNKVYWLQP
ncbi:MAG: BNR repeat-containing protein [Verrucomicrobiota bacterium]|nr:BNR repeat-containing protein [Verrucomicrobiota bacterium]